LLKRLLINYIGPVYFFLKASWVIGFGARYKLTEGCLHYVLIIKEVMFLTLIRTTHLIELFDILILHLLYNCKISPFGSVILEINIAEVRKVDIHFTDGSKEFSAVECSFSLREEVITCCALDCSENSTNSLVTSPFSKISTLTIGPYLENF
jgi:hypothetical protein